MVSDFEAKLVKEAERATNLAERYAEAIAQITLALRNEAITPEARILRAQTVIAGLVADAGLGL